MADWTDGFFGRERPGIDQPDADHGDRAALRRVVRDLLAGWQLVVLAVVAALALAVLVLRQVTPEYSAAMVIGPTARTGAAAMGTRAPLHDRAPQQVNLAEPGNGEETLSDFARFLQLVGSVPVAERLMTEDPELARRLFPERWDPATARWTAPAGAVPTAKRLLLALAGREDWVVPDGEAVARVLRRRVVVEPVGTGPMRRLAFRHPDRAFAIRLLDRLARLTDAHLRAEAARRTTAHIDYVKAQLARVTVAEHRRVLSDLLADQERALMMIEVDLPFAADPIEPASAPARPDWPDPFVLLPLAGVAGLAFGVFLASARAAWGRR